MSKFEFTITIISIVIAFALSELMAGWGRILRHRPRPKIDWLFSGWSAGILLLGVLHWSGLWLYADVDFDSLSQLFALLAPPLVLVAIAFLLAPNPPPGSELDLRAYVTDVSRPVLILLALFLVLSHVADIVVAGSPVFGALGAVALAYAAFLIAVAFSANASLRVGALAALWIIFLPMAFGLIGAPGW